MTARKAAFDALMKVEKGSYSNIAIDGVLGGSQLDARDRALASGIFYGVLERTILLDHIISQYVSRPLSKLDKNALVLLRMGIYQLSFMDRIPDSAAVNECVAIAKRTKNAHISGFINAVLRSYIRAGKKYSLPPNDSAEYKEIKYSCPAYMIGLLRESYGEELCSQFLDALEGAPPVFIRMNTERANEQKLRDMLAFENAALSPTILKNAYRLEGSGDIAGLRAFKRGLFHVQDLSSQLCCLMLGARSGETVYDVCAAPGGKSFTIAEHMTGNGQVVACDLHPHRVKLIADGARRLGLDCIMPTVRDALSSGKEQTADRVLCDVPCSGLGVLRRKPDLKRRTIEEISELPALQLKILLSSAKLVKPGGTIVYSTCTLNPAENEGVFNEFLLQNGDFEPYDMTLPEKTRKRKDEPPYMLTLFPERDGGDGFFIARAKRKSK